MDELTVVLVFDILQWLGKHICCLIIGTNMVHGDLSIVHHLSDVVIPDIKMLCPLMMSWIACQCQSSLIVTVKLSWLVLVDESQPL